LSGYSYHSAFGIVGNVFDLCVSKGLGQIVRVRSCNASEIFASLLLPPAPLLETLRCPTDIQGSLPDPKASLVDFSNIGSLRQFLSFLKAQIHEPFYLQSQYNGQIGYSLPAQLVLPTGNWMARNFQLDQYGLLNASERASGPLSQQKTRNPFSILDKLKLPSLRSSCSYLSQVFRSEKSCSTKFYITGALSSLSYLYPLASELKYTTVTSGV